jgi:hypothetical protein
MLFLFTLTSFSAIAGLTPRKDCPPREESRFDIMKKEMLTWEKQLEQEFASIEVVGRGKTMEEEKRAQEIRGILLHLDHLQQVFSRKKMTSFIRSF